MGVHEYFGRERKKARVLRRELRPEDSEGLKVRVFVDGMDRIHGVATMYRSVQALVGEERTELLRIVCCGGEDNPSEEGVHTLRKVATFTGFLRGEALARLYVSCDVFVFPSTTDTLGQAVAEAQASGLPSVVCGIGGPRECIRPGVSGFVADPGDEEVFFTKIELLLEDPRLRDRMGRVAREFAAGMAHGLGVIRGGHLDTERIRIAGERDSLRMVGDPDAGSPHGPGRAAKGREAVLLGEHRSEITLLCTVHERGSARRF